VHGTPIIVNIIIIIAYDLKVCRGGRFDGRSHAGRTKRLYIMRIYSFLYTYIYNNNNMTSEEIQYYWYIEYVYDMYNDIFAFRPFADDTTQRPTLYYYNIIIISYFVYCRNFIFYYY